MAAFLTALALSGNVSKAATAVGIDRMTAYRWRKDDAEFSANWDEAMEIAVLGMEDECKRRAFEGFDVATKNGVVRGYSDTLAIFLLKAHAPEKYRERSNVELTGANGGPIKTESMSDAQIAQALNAIATMTPEPTDGATPEIEDDGSDLV